MLQLSSSCQILRGQDQHALVEHPAAAVSLLARSRPPNTHPGPDAENLISSWRKQSLILLCYYHSQKQELEGILTKDLMTRQASTWNVDVTELLCIHNITNMVFPLLPMENFPLPSFAISACLPLAWFLLGYKKGHDLPLRHVQQSAGPTCQSLPSQLPPFLMSM